MGYGVRTGIAASGVCGAEAAVGVGGSVGLALDQCLTVILHLHIALGRVECEEVVDKHARHARANLVRAKGLEPVGSASGAVLHTPVHQRRRH